MHHPSDKRKTCNASPLGPIWDLKMVPKWTSNGGPQRKKEQAKKNTKIACTFYDFGPIWDLKMDPQWTNFGRLDRRGGVV